MLRFCFVSGGAVTARRTCSASSSVLSSGRKSSSADFASSRVASSCQQSQAAHERPCKNDGITHPVGFIGSCMPESKGVAECPNCTVATVALASKNAANNPASYLWDFQNLTVGIGRPRCGLPYSLLRRRVRSAQMHPAAAGANGASSRASSARLSPPEGIPRQAGSRCNGHRISACAGVVLGFLPAVCFAFLAFLTYSRR